MHTKNTGKLSCVSSNLIILDITSILACQCKHSCYSIANFLCYYIAAVFAMYQFQVGIDNHIILLFYTTLTQHTICGKCCTIFISSRETYNTLTTWLTDARTLASPNIVIILVGNKRDLDADREVTFLEASRFAQENGS